jgi:NAD(P)-dependent dehydrogenase (short-subunit alcohol dehydrogenase family)
MDTAIVMGVGPDQGMGAQLCKRFSSLGLHVFVAGRTQAKLDAVVEGIRADGGDASAVAADATVEADVVELFAQAAGQSWRICCYGGFLFGREAVRHMKSMGGGTLLFTGASASMRGRPNFGAFNSSKAALRTLAQAMAKEYGRDGIHVGHVVIDGAIYGEKVRTKFPDFAEKLGEAGMINIGAIVDAYEYLYKQPKTGWSFEVDVRTAIESW